MGTLQARESAQLELEAGEGEQDEQGGKDPQASEAPQQEQQQDQPEQDQEELPEQDAGPKEEADAKQSFTQPEVSPGWGFLCKRARIQHLKSLSTSRCATAQRWRMAARQSHTTL